MAFATPTLALKLTIIEADKLMVLTFRINLHASPN